MATLQGQPGPARSPLLTEPGAVPADGPDAGVAAHYGDPFAEQRGIAGGWGVVDASGRGVIRITGPDRLSWLHSLSTQAVDRLPPGASAQTLVLSPQGHIEHHLTLTDDGTAIWAHVEPGTAPALLDFLTSMKFMLRVDPQDVSADYAVLSLLGPGVPADRPAVVRIDTGHGTDLIVPRAELAAQVAQLRAAGAVLAGSWASEACYRGQETVARVHNLGHPPRRLVLLHLDGSEDLLPGHGDTVRMDGSAIGVIGSAARHYELGPIALALVKRTTPVDATLEAAGVAAAQEVIVSPDAGANVQIELKRRDLMGRTRG